jgi:hypothetical protein
MPSATSPIHDPVAGGQPLYFQLVSNRTALKEFFGRERARRYNSVLNSGAAIGEEFLDRDIRDFQIVGSGAVRNTETALPEHAVNDIPAQWRLLGEVDPAEVRSARTAGGITRFDARAAVHAEIHGLQFMPCLKRDAKRSYPQS